MARDKAIETYGVITECLGSDRYRVELENGIDITAYPCGRIRQNRIRLIPGDKVRVELSPYDLSNGRIARRL